MEIKSKNDIIDYFTSGIKQDELIGVENEQFLFNIKTKKRAEYENIKKLLQIFITKFGWQEIKENENLIGLKFKIGKLANKLANKLDLLVRLISAVKCIFLASDYLLVNEFSPK